MECALPRLAHRWLSDSKTQKDEEVENLGSYRWRKTTDVAREYPLFELLFEGTPVLDMGFNDERILEVSFDSTAGGLLLSWERLQELLIEGKALAEAE
ncbi:hypothetical protein [Dolichospermum circinale]|jgi:hypothetical protein|uniref:hypothetical protein n=1 Tax=Dolichospermum circinale TaxID=109265 RepID=UPI002330C84D|nr:hypothetical protein [Dolichospermum circinale]MDB9475761.1 hypothetical protein [Dolichospermum circinale CS-537/11]